MLVSEVIDRTYNEWLYPRGENRPPYDKLSAGIDASTLTIPVTGRLGSPSPIPADTVIEIESELILVESVAALNITAAPSGRGWLETDAATHAISSLVWVDPVFTRKAIFNSLVSVMGLLYPAGVYARMYQTTETFTPSVPVKTLPTGGKRLISISVKSTGTVETWNDLRPGIDYKNMNNFTPPKYQLYRGGSTGAVMQVTYAADFTLPTAESDQLNTLAFPLPSSIQPFLPTGVAGYLLQGQEVPRVIAEEIKRRLALEGVPPGAVFNVGQSLLDRFMSRYAAAERDRLKELDSAVGIEFVRR